LYESGYKRLSIDEREKRLNENENKLIQNEKDRKNATTQEIEEEEEEGKKEENSFTSLRKYHYPKRKNTITSETIKSSIKRNSLKYTTSFENVIESSIQEIHQGNQGNCEALNLDVAMPEQGITGDNINQKNNNSSKKKVRVYGKLNFVNFIIFIQLFWINMVRKVGFWLIDRKKTQNNKGIVRKIIEKTKDYNLEVLRRIMVSLGFWLVVQMNFWYKVSNKIKGIFSYFTKRNKAKVQ